MAGALSNNFCIDKQLGVQIGLFGNTDVIHLHVCMLCSQILVSIMRYVCND